MDYESTEKLLTREFALQFPDQHARLWALNLEIQFLKKDLEESRKLNDEFVSSQIGYSRSGFRTQLTVLCVKRLRHSRGRFRCAARPRACQIGL